MKLCILFLSVLVFGCVSTQKDDDPLDDDAVIAEVNKQKLGWTAGKNDDTHKKNKKEKIKKLGNRNLETAPPLNPSAPIARGLLLKQVTTIPTSFDSRTRWTACAARTGEIRNQGSCGSCWAHAFASMLSDRLCITRNLANVKISVQDQINCMPASLIPATWSTDLCQGFTALYATRMAFSTGIVTGGEVNQTTGCKPYTTRAFTNGLGGLTCPTTCSNPAYTTAYATDRRKTTGTVVMGFQLASWGANSQYTYNYDSQNYLTGPNPGLDTVERLIQKEIMTRGPVAASFDVYNDFFSYRSGVYRKSTTLTSNPYVGGHAIKIIGWGVNTTTNTKFWTVVNSWGARWGEAGLFRIERGTNHVKIEDLIIASIV